MQGECKKYLYNKLSEICTKIRRSNVLSQELSSYGKDSKIPPKCKIFDEKRGGSIVAMIGRALQINKVILAHLGDLKNYALGEKD